MKKCSIFLFLLIGFSNIFAQNDSQSDAIYIRIEQDKLKNNGKDIEGSPYIFPIMDAEVKGVDGTTKMRYNAYNDEVEYKTENGTLALIKQAKFNDIYFPAQNRHLKLLNYNYNGKQIEGYLYEEVANPNVKIYKREHIDFIDEKPARSSYDEGAPATYKLAKPVYFIQFGDAALIELPENKKKLAELFPNKKEDLKQYFKNNKVDFSKQSDLQKLAEILK